MNLRSKQPVFPVHHFLGQHQLLFSKYFISCILNPSKLFCTLTQRSSCSMHSVGIFRSKTPKRGSKLFYIPLYWKLYGYRWNFRLICPSLSVQRLGSSGFLWNQTWSSPKCIPHDGRCYITERLRLLDKGDIFRDIGVHEGVEFVSHSRIFLMWEHPMNRSDEAACGVDFGTTVFWVEWGFTGDFRLVRIVFADGLGRVFAFQHNSTSIVKR